jgi:protein TonB
MSLYLLYRSRQWLSGVPALAALATLLITLHTEPLKIEPVYDESAVELALVEPPPPPPPPAAEPLPTPPPPVPVEPAPVEEPPPVVEDAEAVLPPPKPPTPKVVAKPPPPMPKPAPRPVAKNVPKPAPTPAPPIATPAAPRPAPVSSPAAPARPAPVAPNVDTAGLEGGYMQGLRNDMDRFKQYPSGRQASLERPTGNVVVWMLVDRAGNVLDSGIETPAPSMLLNRAASTSLKRIKQVKPFPEQAFGGRHQQRFTATFNYSVQ